jgi:hypothetical protein
LVFSVFFGGGSLSPSFVGRVGGKVKMDGDGSFFVDIAGSSSGWALARLPSRSLQARIRLNRQINPPRDIHAYWVLCIGILAPLFKG